MYREYDNKMDALNKDYLLILGLTVKHIKKAEKLEKKVQRNPSKNKQMLLSASIIIIKLIALLHDEIEGANVDWQHGLLYESLERLEKAEYIVHMVKKIDLYGIDVEEQKPEPKRKMLLLPAPKPEILMLPAPATEPSNLELILPKAEKLLLTSQ